MRFFLFLPLLAFTFFTSCNKTKLAQLETELAGEKKQRAMLETQVASYEKTNSDLLNRMEDLAVISKEGATSARIMRYRKAATIKWYRQCSVSLALVELASPPAILARLLGLLAPSAPVAKSPPPWCSRLRSADTTA